MEKACSRSVLADAQSERQNEADGSWQHEALYNEELDLVRHSDDFGFEGVLMLPAQVRRLGELFLANYLEVFLGNGRLSVWTSAQVRVCHSEVKQEDEDRQSIAQIFCGKARAS